MEATDKLYWTKVLMATIIGAVFSLAQLAIPLSGITFLVLGFTAYVLLSDLLSRLFGVEKGKALKIGIGAYIFTWLTVWVVIFTLLHPVP
jgi:hypothetical protein